ncbi:hypothetical protein EVG20_g11708, partial [Dentipellis fragilis]
PSRTRPTRARARSHRPLAPAALTMPPCADAWPRLLVGVQVVVSQHIIATPAMLRASLTCTQHNRRSTSPPAPALAHTSPPATISHARTLAAVPYHRQPPPYRVPRAALAHAPSHRPCCAQPRAAPIFAPPALVFTTSARPPHPLAVAHLQHTRTQAHADRTLRMAGEKMEYRQGAESHPTCIHRQRRTRRRTRLRARRRLSYAHAQLPASPARMAALLSLSLAGPPLPTACAPLPMAHLHPLAPSHPPARLGLLLADAQVRLSRVLTSTRCGTPSRALARARLCLSPARPSAPGCHRAPVPIMASRRARTVAGRSLAPGHLHAPRPVAGRSCVRGHPRVPRPAVPPPSRCALATARDARPLLQPRTVRQRLKRTGSYGRLPRADASPRHLPSRERHERPIAAVSVACTRSRHYISRGCAAAAISHRADAPPPPWLLLTHPPLPPCSDSPDALPRVHILAAVPLAHSRWRRPLARTGDVCISLACGRAQPTP